MHTQNTQIKFILLLFIIFLSFLGAAMPYTIFAPLFLHPTHGGLSSIEWSTHTRNMFLGFTLAVYPFGQFIGSPTLGRLSDMFGRKTLLMVTLFGTGIGYIFTAFSIHYHVLSGLIISRFLTGFLEGNLVIAQAYIADLPINKHKGFGAISALASMGYLFGPLLGGFLSNHTFVAWFNYSVPFYAAALLSLIAFTIVWLLLENVIKKIAPNEAILHQFNIFKRFMLLARNIELKWLLINGFFLFLAIDTYYEFYPALLVVRWHYTASHIAIINIALSLGLCLGSFFMAGALIKRFSTKASLIACMLLLIMVFLIFLFTDNQFFLYPQFVLIGLTYGAVTTYHSVLISDSASDAQQGEAMGISWGIRMLGDTVTCIVGAVLIGFSIKIPMVVTFACFCIYLFIFIIKVKYTTLSESNK